MTKSLTELKTPVDLPKCTRIAHYFFICKVFWSSWTQTFDLSQKFTLLTLLEEAAVWKLLLYGKSTKLKAKTRASPFWKVMLSLNVFTREFLGHPKGLQSSNGWNVSSLSEDKFENLQHRFQICSLFVKKHMQPFKHCVYFHKTSQLSWTVYLQWRSAVEEEF